MSEKVDYKFPNKPEVKPLDYSKVENWIINANADTNTDYDLVFFCGTSVFKTNVEGGVGYNPALMRSVGYSSYALYGKQLSENARVFCPVQRQIALDYAIRATSNKDLLFNIATKEPYVDLEAALDYYFENYNEDAQRPFVLAGHSQGSASLQVALAKYFLLTDKKDYLKNMVAAYSLGYGVSKEYFDALPNKEGRLHFAEGESDFNCLISWNTEGVGDKGKNFLLGEGEYSTLLINPLNWRTDETYASINENQGVLVFERQADGKTKHSISLLPEHLCDAQIDLKRGSVLCSTRRDYNQIPGSEEELWGGKSLHDFDGPGYYNNMKSNLRLRVKNFLAAKAAEQAE